jgi:ABC-2 type transport system permease protein
MKLFLAFVKKEFIHILRDRKTMLILFGMPISLILIFGFALTNEVKDVKVVLLDQAKDALSQQLIAKIAASPYFELQAKVSNSKEIEAAFKKAGATVAVVFPPDFSRELLRSGKAQLQLIVDGSDPNTASTIINYLQAIIAGFENSLAVNKAPGYQINVISRMQYNPQMKPAHNFVPGVMALVLMLVCVMMTAVGIVKEKETGTMELLLISPVKPVFIIASKAFPYLVLSLINVAAILLLTVFVLRLPINGSIWLLYAESALFILSSLALGICISVLTSSQQIAMLIALMGMLIPTIMFSGFMFPIENMPFALQMLANIIPAKWFYSIAQDIMVKGSGIAQLWRPTLVLAGMTTVFFFISLKTFKIRLE